MLAYCTYSVLVLQYSIIMKTCFEGRAWVVLELLSWPRFERFFFSLSCFATPKDS